MKNLNQFQNKLLEDFNVDLKFSKNAIKDFKALDIGKRREILKAIAKQAIKGPMIKPYGIGKPLRSPLQGFVKIKLKSMNERIIYRPIQINEQIRMEIIAIGHCDGDKVYKAASERILQFIKEMEGK